MALTFEVVGLCIVDLFSGLLIFTFIFIVSVVSVPNLLRFLLNFLGGS